jgi:hypothetical protein
LLVLIFITFKYTFPHFTTIDVRHNLCPSCDQNDSGTHHLSHNLVDGLRDLLFESVKLLRSSLSATGPVLHSSRLFLIMCKRRWEHFAEKDLHLGVRLKAMMVRVQSLTTRVRTVALDSLRHLQDSEF